METPGHRGADMAKTERPESDVPAGERLTPIPLMQLTSGFWSFKSFAAAVELELFTRLDGGRVVTTDEMASELGFEHRPTDLLLTVCTSLGLLDKTEDGYRNSPLAQEFLVIGRPYYFGAFVRYCDQREYPAWHRLVDGLRTNRPLTWDPDTQDTEFSAEDPVMMTLFWEGMHSISASTAREVGTAYDFRPHRRLLDVGGGSGAFDIELCRRYGHLSATVFDLPHVCEIAAGKAAQAGLRDRIATLPGDYKSDDPLPGGHDAMLLSLVLHDEDPATNRRLLSKCHDALEPGGAVLICEPVLNAARTGPAPAALLGMNLLVETASGRSYSAAEHRDLLHGVGFDGVRSIPIEAAGANEVIVGRKA